MTAKFYSYFGIRTQERSKALWFFLLMLAISLFYTLASTIGDALFIDKIGEERIHRMLPWYYVGVAIATITVTWTVDWFLDRRQKLALFVVLELLFALSVLLLRWGLELTDEEWLYFVIMVWLEVIGLISLTIFFSFMGDFYTSRDARRLYGFINGGYPLGNLIMGFSITPMLLFIAAEDLLILAAILIALVAIIPLRIHRQEAMVIDREKQRELTGDAPLRKVLGHPFVLLIFLMIVADLFYFVFIDFELKIMAAREFGKEELAAFFGQLYGVVGLVQIVIQFVLVSWLLRKFGILSSLMINAILALLVIFAFALHPTLMLIALANIARYAFSETLDVPARELLYFPLAGRLRERAQTFANGILAPLAQGLAGLTLLLLVPLLSGIISLAVFAMLFAGIWLYAIYRLFPLYQKALEDSLVNWDFNPENIDRLLEQKGSRGIFRRLVEEQRFAEIIALLEFVPSHSNIDFRDDFYTLLRINDGPTRLKVLELIKNRPGEFDFSEVRPLLDDPEEEVAAMAVEVYCLLRKEDAFEEVSPYLEHEVLTIRVAAKASLALHGGLDAALSIFPKIKEDLTGPLAARIEAVKVITRMNYPASARVLRPILAGSEIRLKREVLGALSRLHDSSIVPDLMPLLLIPSLEESVTAALERMPPKAATHIVAFINNTPLDTLHRIRLIRLLGKFPHKDSRSFLIRQYQEETNPIQRVNSLSALVDLRQIEGFEEGPEWADDEIEWAISNFSETQRALGACREGDGRIRELLLDHYHYQVEILLGLLTLYYGIEVMERPAIQLFSEDHNQRANALELFEMNLDRHHKIMVIPVLNFYVDPPMLPGPDLTTLWIKELPSDPFLRMIRTYYQFRKAPPGVRKVDAENKNVLGVLSIVSFLKKVDLFSEIPANYLIPIAEMMKHKTAFAGEILFEKGDMGDSLYLIQKGSVEILLDSKRVITVKVGEAIGDMALIDGEPRSATARVAEDSRLLHLRSYDFNRLLLSYPIIAKSLLRILSRRLRIANRRG